MKEWREIDGFPNYMVSNTGEIKSLNYNKTGKLIPHKLSNGYLGINLYDNDKKSCYLLIHRLVAQAFLPNPNGCRIINHKDENRSNNPVNNLEWCSHKYNLIFSIPALQYSKTREFLKEFPSIAEAARTVNNGNIKAAVTNILKCCNGVADTQFGTVKRKTAYGYIWKFKTL